MQSKKNPAREEQEDRFPPCLFAPRCVTQTCDSLHLTLHSMRLKRSGRNRTNFALFFLFLWEGTNFLDWRTDGKERRAQALDGLLTHTIDSPRPCACPPTNSPILSTPLHASRFVQGARARVVPLTFRLSKSIDGNSHLSLLTENRLKTELRIETRIK